MLGLYAEGSVCPLGEACVSWGMVASLLDIRKDLGGDHRIREDGPCMATE